MPGVDGVEDRPQVGQPVLDRRAGEGELLAGGQGAHGLGRVGGGVLDQLRLVGDDGRPVDGAEVLDVAGQQPVRGDDEVGAGRAPARPRSAPWWTTTRSDGREAGGLGLPVVDDRQRAHDEVRSGPFEQVGERGRRSCPDPCRRPGSRRGRGGRGTAARPGRAAGTGRSSPTKSAGSCSSPQPLVGQAGQQLVGPRPARRRSRCAGAAVGPARRRRRGAATSRRRRRRARGRGPRAACGPGAWPPGRCAPTVGRCATAWRRPARPAPARRRRSPPDRRRRRRRASTRRRPGGRTACRGRRRPAAWPGRGRDTPARTSRSGPTSSMPRGRARPAPARGSARRPRRRARGRPARAGGRGRRRRRRSRRPRAASSPTSVGQTGQVLAPAGHLDGERAWRPTRPRPSTTGRDRARRRARGGPPSRRRGRPGRRAGPGAGRPARRAGAGRGARTGRPARRSSSGWARPLPPISGSGDARARSTERAADVAGSRRARQRGPEVALGQSMAGQGVDQRGVDVGDGRRVVRRRDADRRHGRGQRVERIVDDGVGDRDPAGDGQLAVRADARRDEAGGRPSPWRGGRRRRTRRASRWSGRRPAIERSQRADRSAGSRTAAGRMASPSGSATSSDDR